MSANGIVCDELNTYVALAPSLFTPNGLVEAAHALVNRGVNPDERLRYIEGAADDIPLLGFQTTRKAVVEGEVLSVVER